MHFIKVMINSERHDQINEVLTVFYVCYVQIICPTFVRVRIADLKTTTYQKTPAHQLITFYITRNITWNRINANKNQ